LPLVPWRPYFAGGKANERPLSALALMAKVLLALIAAAVVALIGAFVFAAFTL
jgi:hypothetical protein